MLVLAGLGNPGPRYARNRHNVGFEIVAALAEAARAPAWREKFQAELARCTLGTTESLLIRPLTFMNESGRSIQAALAFFRLSPADLVVVHDELDLPFGTLRIKVGGGHAGHNGLRSIVECLGSSDFARLRVGIGRPPPGFTGDVADYVLSDFSPDERAALPEITDKGVKALRDIAMRGVAAASNSLNARPKPPKAPVAPAPDRAHESAPAGGGSQPPPHPPRS